MESEILCACCHNKIDFESLPVCDRCGFINQLIIGDVDVSDKNARDHRRQMIEKLKNISVACYQYGWDNVEKKYTQLSKEKHKIADGPECDGKVVWAPYDFGQWFDDSEKTVPIEISFQYNGTGYTATSKFIPKQREDFWHVGVMVTEDLRLVVCFGSKVEYATSMGLDFLTLPTKK